MTFPLFSFALLHSYVAFCICLHIYFVYCFRLNTSINIKKKKKYGRMNWLKMCPKNCFSLRAIFLRSVFFFPKHNAYFVLCCKTYNGNSIYTCYVHLKHKNDSLFFSLIMLLFLVWHWSFHRLLILHTDRKICDNQNKKTAAFFVAYSGKCIEDLKKQMQ